MSVDSAISKRTDLVYSSMKRLLSQNDYQDLLQNSYLAGGAITSIMMGEEVNDYDIFFKNPNTAENVVSVLLGKLSGRSGFSSSESLTETTLAEEGLWLGGLSKTPSKTRTKAIDATNHGGINTPKMSLRSSVTKSPRVKFISNNAVTLSNGIQLIFRFVGEPDKVFKTFDYEHCKVASIPQPFGLNFSEVEYHGKSLQAISGKELIYTQNSWFVLSAIQRMSKFASRGWKPSVSTCLNLMESASRIDLESPDVVERELSTFYGIGHELAKRVVKASLEDDKINKNKLFKLVEKL